MAHDRLIPSLPNELALLCVAKVPDETRLVLRCVSRVWRRALGRPKRLRLLVCVGITKSTWYAFDRMLCRWENIPPPPSPPRASTWWHKSTRFVDWAVYWRLLRGSPPAEVITLYGPHTFCLKTEEKETKEGGLSTKYSWFGAGSMTEEGRWKYAASASEDGEFVYVAGGLEMRENKKRHLLKSAERFNVKRMRWEGLPPLHEQTSHAYGRMLSDGRFCISTGTSVRDEYTYGEAYDPATRQWSVVHCPVSLQLYPKVVVKGQCYHIEFTCKPPHEAVLMRDGCCKSLGAVPIPADTNLHASKLIAMGHELLVLANEMLLVTSPCVLPLCWTQLSLPFHSRFIRSHVVFGGAKMEKEREPVNYTVPVRRIYRHSRFAKALF